MNKAEKDYNNSSDSSRRARGNLRYKFVSKHKTFDKYIIRTERQYNKHLLIDIEQVSTTNHR